jgi:hypothetical protein
LTYSGSSASNILTAYVDGVSVSTTFASSSTLFNIAPSSSSSSLKPHPPAAPLAPKKAVEKKDKLKGAEARTKALSYVLPGAIMQPSGIFANVMAGEAGCHFVRAV